jgi:ABC-type cobalamin transport system permease subunit
VDQDAVWHIPSRRWDVAASAGVALIAALDADAERLDSLGLRLCAFCGHVLELLLFIRLTK